jgi:peroxin-6
MSVKGPELLGSYVGESEANLRAVFQSAREAAEQNAPVFASILFFDELDSLAPKRGGVGDGGGVMERVVATLCAELDAGASTTGRIFVMGATNRPDLLDPSLLRPGRLDRSVYLGISTDHDERARILAAQLHRLKLDGHPMEMSRAVVAKLPPRLTGADFSSIASGALLLAVERLCRMADDEKNSSSRELDRDIEIDEILKGWNKDKCTPTILMEDILRAAETVVPSVSEEELNRYERLKEQYGAKEQAGSVEHDGDIFYQAEVHGSVA